MSGVVRFCGDFVVWCLSVLFVVYVLMCSPALLCVIVLCDVFLFLLKLCVCVLFMAKISDIV